MPPESIEPLNAELSMLGYEAYTAETSAGTPGTSFDTDGQEVFQQFGNTKNIVLVGLSRGFNIILRTALQAEDAAKQERVGRVAISHLVTFAGSSDVSTIPLIEGEDRRDRNSTAFRKLIRHIDDELTVIYDKNDRKMSPEERARQERRIIEIMCVDSDRTTQKEFLEELRPHRRIDNEPNLRRKPSVPLTYIRSSEDRVINPVFVEDRVIPYFDNSQLLEFPGSHLAPLAHPELAAKYLVAIARGYTRFPSQLAVKSLSAEALSQVYFPDITYDKEKPADDGDDDAPAREIW
jgi:pimeloyl-ACP methyl ester carboxylesterase